MSISEIFPVKKSLPQIPITKSTTYRMSNQTYENRKHPCTICGKRFKASNHLKEHMTLHSDSTNYKCEKCNQEFKAPGAWRNHMRKLHGFECLICNKVFSTLTLQRAHKLEKHKISGGIKLEDEIGMIRKNGNTIKSIRSKIVQTKPSQQKSINVASQRITHSVSQGPKSIVKKILAKSRSNGAKKSKSGKFECKTCGMKYTLSRSLRRHLDTAHRDALKYSCRYCGYNTNRSDNFKLHMERHAGGTPLKCTISSCKLVFFSPKNLGIHLKKVHSNGIVGNLSENSIKIEKVEESFEDMDGEENELLDELDQSFLTHGENFDENGEKFGNGFEEKIDDSFKFFDNSFLNSTEKSTRFNNSAVQTRSSAKPSKPGKNSAQKPSQLKISTCVSLGSRRNEKKPEETKNERPKSTEWTDNSVRYECVECKIGFSGNTELWDHLLAIHFHKMKNNVKKT